MKARSFNEGHTLILGCIQTFITTHQTQNHPRVKDVQVMAQEYMFYGSRWVLQWADENASRPSLTPVHCRRCFAIVVPMQTIVDFHKALML